MSNLKSFALASGLVLASTFAAAAADLLPPPPPFLPPAPQAPAGDFGGWYLRGDVGIGITQLDKLTPQPLGVYDTLTVRDKAISEQFFVGGGVGYKINSFVRFDVTGEYRGGAKITGTDFITYGGGAGQLVNNYSGNLRTAAFLANGYVDLGTFCQLGCITPFLGAGVGFANHSVSGLTDQGQQYVGGFPAPPLGAHAKTTDKTRFAFALMAGLGYEVNKNLTLELGYRYLNMGDGPDMRLIGNSSGAITGDVLKFKQIDSHDIKLGMRWNLNGDCCGSAPPPPPPPPLYRKG